MIVVDTSAWVELLRATGSSVHRRLRRAISEREEIAVTEVIVSELIGGARSERDRQEALDMLFAFTVLPLRGLADFEAAGDLYRACRAAGDSVGGIADCLIAVPAIEAGARVLHHDRHFDVLARHTPLEVVLGE